MQFGGAGLPVWRTYTAAAAKDETRMTQPITDRKIRVALVGCGRIAASHFQALERHADRAELVAVCDTDPQRLEAAARDFGGDAIRDLQETRAAGWHGKESPVDSHSRDSAWEKPGGEPGARVIRTSRLPRRPRRPRGGSDRKAALRKAGWPRARSCASRFQPTTSKPWR